MHVPTTSFTVSLPTKLIILYLIVILNYSEFGLYNHESQLSLTLVINIDNLIVLTIFDLQVFTPSDVEGVTKVKEM